MKLFEYIPEKSLAAANSPKSLKRDRNYKIYSFRFLYLVIFLFILAGPRNVWAQDELPLNLYQIEFALRSPNAPLATKNTLLIGGVKERKTTFLVTPEIEKRLRAMGAGPALISALRTNEPPPARIIQPKSAQTVIKNSIGMELVLIPKGEFMMGAQEGIRGPIFDTQRPFHKVVIGQDFYLGKYEVTQAEWKLVMGKNPSTYPLGESFPVETVSWSDIKKFIEKLNQKRDGFSYRLPSEAEWEYAARGGTGTAYYWGDDPEEKDYQYYVSANNENPVRVGSFLPNGFGLYDMSGNVWELCEDVWTPNYKAAKGDGSANLTGEDTNKKVMRGGAYGNYSDDRRSDIRRPFDASQPYYNLGFRLVAVASKP